MTLLALTAVICFGFAVYNLTCAFADIPTKRTSRMMLLARKQQGVKAEKLLDVCKGTSQVIDSKAETNHCCES